MYKSLRRDSKFLIWLISGVTTAMCLVVASQRVPLWGRIAWGFNDSPNWPLAFPAIGMVAALLFVHKGLYGLENKWSLGRELGLITLLCILTVCLNLSLRTTEKNGLSRLPLLTINPASGGFFEAAYDSQPQKNWLANYPELMKNHHHVYTHPPGGVAVMRWWLQLSKNPLIVSVADDALLMTSGVGLEAIANFCSRVWKRPYLPSDVAAAFWGAFTFIVMVALIPACIYLHTRLLFNMTAAAHAALLAAFVPSFMLFTPACDLSYVFFSALTLALATLGTLRQKPLWMLAAGAVAGCGLVFSFALVPVMLLAVCFIYLQNSVPARRVQFTLAASFCCASAATILMFYLLGVDWVEIARITRESTAKWNIERDLNPWTQYGLHLVDFFTFLGLPVSILALTAIFQWRQKRSEWVNIAAVLFPVLGVILFTNLVSPFAETARIWMLFMPPLLVAAGAIMHNLTTRLNAEPNTKVSGQPSRYWLSLPTVLLGLQAVQLLVFSLYLNVWSF